MSFDKGIDVRHAGVTDLDCVPVEDVVQLGTLRKSSVTCAQHSWRRSCSCLNEFHLLWICVVRFIQCVVKKVENRLTSRKTCQGFYSPTWLRTWFILGIDTPASCNVQEICTRFRFGRNANGSCSCLHKLHLLWKSKEGFIQYVVKKVENRLTSRKRKNCQGF